MSTVLNIPAPAAAKWQAGFTERRIYVKVQDEETGKVRSFPLDLLYVVLSRGSDDLLFCVNRRKGSLTFTDYREQFTGSTGTAGLWGSLPPQKPGRRRSLSPSAWVSEVARLIGTERAREIVRILGG